MTQSQKETKELLTKDQMLKVIESFIFEFRTESYEDRYYKSDIETKDYFVILNRMFREIGYAISQFKLKTPYNYKEIKELLIKNISKSDFTMSKLIAIAFRMLENR